jgi:hypothetical protein
MSEAAAAISFPADVAASCALSCVFSEQAESAMAAAAAARVVKMGLRIKKLLSVASHQSAMALRVPDERIVQRKRARLSEKAAPVQAWMAPVSVGVTRGWR